MCSSDLNAASIRVSLFIEPDAGPIEMAKELSAPVIELHTGTYCEAFAHGDHTKADRELERLRKGAELAGRLGLEVHAGHGLDFATAEKLAAIPEIRELNIGHFIIGEAIFIGLHHAIMQMRAAINQGRTRARPRS